MVQRFVGLDESRQVTLPHLQKALDQFWDPFCQGVCSPLALVAGVASVCGQVLPVLTFSDARTMAKHFEH